MNIVDINITDKSHCPICGRVMELLSFDRFTSVEYVGLEPLLLCNNTPICLKERWKTIQEARQRRDTEHPEIILSLNGVPKRFQNCSFENFKGNPKAVQACRNHDLSNGLYMFGGAGRGKTHLAVAKLRELVKTGHYDFQFASLATLLSKLARAAFDTNKSSESEARLVEKYSQTNILVLDDLGQHGASPWVITKLYLIIDSRYSEEKPTIITSNFGLDEIHKKLGEPIASRLSESRIIHITGLDYRKQ